MATKPDQTATVPSEQDVMDALSPPVGSEVVETTDTDDGEVVLAEPTVDVDLSTSAEPIADGVVEDDPKEHRGELVTPTEESTEVSLNDDDIIEVMVDGKVEDVAFGDLHKSYSHQKGAADRFRRANELLQTAIAVQTPTLSTLAGHEAVLSEMLKSVKEGAVVAIIDPPSEELKNADPNRYIQHIDAYTLDQKRIKDAHDLMDTTINDLAVLRADRLKEYEKLAQTYLQEHMPELFDKEKGPEFAEHLATSAKAYGYSAQEIATALDPRMFMLVRDAQRYKTLMNNPENLLEPTDGTELPTSEKSSKKRVVRIRSVATSRKSRTTQNTKERQAAWNKAAETGHPDDIAKIL